MTTTKTAARTADTITVTKRDDGRWEARDAEGHPLATGTTKYAALAKALSNLSNAGQDRSQKLTADVFATLMHGAQELGEITLPAGTVVNWIDPKSGLRSGPHGERVWRFVATVDGEQNTYTACTGADVLLPVPGLKDPERFQ